MTEYHGEHGPELVLEDEGRIALDFELGQACSVEDQDSCESCQ